MLDQAQLLQLVLGVKFPDEDKYFEQTASDGWAYLGMARHNMKLDYSVCLQNIEDKWGTVSEDRRHYETVVPAYSPRTYQTLPSLLFALQIGRDDVVQSLREKLFDIGTYDNGMFRYSQTEINLIVPNITVMAAFMYYKLDQIDGTIALVNALRDHLDTYGDWSYVDTRTNKVIRLEDSYHQALMLYCFNEIKKEIDIGLDRLIHRTYSNIYKLNDDGILPGSIGFNPSCMLLGNCKRDTILPIVINDSLHSPNFRTRSLAAWALTEKGNINA